MTTKTLPEVAEAMTLVAEDAVKASKEERRYSMGLHEKSRQGDVYFLTLSNEDLPNYGIEIDTSKRPTKKLEIAKSHVLMGSFHVYKTSEETFFVRPKNGEPLMLRHPEHADHVFNVLDDTTLYFYIQKTMDKNSVGARTMD